MATRRAEGSPTATTPVDPAKADVPCAETLVAMLTDDVDPGLVEMLKKVHAAEDAYNTNKSLRDGFCHHETEEGWANLRYYLEQASREVRRIVKSKN